MSAFTSFLLSCILLPFALISSGFESDCVEDQIARMARLEVRYESETAIKVDEQDFCSFDIDDTDLYTFDQFQCVGTHNSYKLYQPDYCYWITSTFFPLFDEDGEAMSYEHEDTTTQLNMGVRSFEWDVSEYSGEFDGYIIQHDTYVDPCSSIPNLELALEEVLMWSEYNEDHMPITILIECKTSLAPSFTSEDIVTSDQVLAMADLISEVLGDKLYTPSDMIGEYDTMEAMRLDGGYPTIEDLQGKIIVILHDGDACENYAADVDFEDQDLFISMESEDSCFVLVTNPRYNRTYMYAMEDEGYLVRTLIAPYGDTDDPRNTFGYLSGANILSSDFIYDYQESDEISITRIDGEYMMDIIDESELTFKLNR